ncbi:hypothetical protein SGFS_013390 [Streptomyces graminofaciens]|uniref:Uncharacterized protein n=1 Tax=Streptomyces graminofaciens TaxID=68212 RepID=A0ABM7F2Q6_9ACTN|nr:hypothetical protein [Streptomyces graminofaciens]BBC30045.1 hypothetical protein SGFS_013390 [Streptomyces graminofaciens]
MTNPETDRRETVEYFVQCQQPDGTWEQASSTATDLDFATERLAARRRMRPEFVYRIAQRTTVVVVGPAPAAVSVPPPATRADAEAVARVRALHQPVECVNVRCKLKQWCIGCDPDGIEGCDENPWPCPTIRALDGEQPSGGPCVAGEQQNETPEHVGGRVNAEDCPACEGTNPPYPFICPGPSAVEEPQS